MTMKTIKVPKTAVSADTNITLPDEIRVLPNGHAVAVHFGDGECAYDSVGELAEAYQIEQAAIQSWA